jgi:hypothetical protein
VLSLSAFFIDGYGIATASLIALAKFYSTLEKVVPPVGCHHGLSVPELHSVARSVVGVFDFCLQAHHYD